MVEWIWVIHSIHLLLQIHISLQIYASNLYLHFEQINLITFLLNLIENEIKLKYSKIYVDKQLFSIYNIK